MSLLRIWLLARGYLVVSVEGKHIERFINLAVSRGVDLWDIFQPRENLMIAKVNLSSYRVLRHIARGAKCKMKIRRKKGLPFFFVRLRNRKMLVAGAVFFFVSLYVLSSFIWFVEVTSNKELKLVTKGEILEAASELGLKRGAPGFLVDNNSVAEAIEKKFSAKVSFVGVQQNGTRVTIDVVEKVLPKRDPQKELPGNIIARKDGLIKEILVLSGEPKVLVGDTVKKGQVLITGVIYPQPPEEEPPKGDEGGGTPEKEQQMEPILVNARGVVRARVWYEARARLPLKQHTEKLTGRRQKLVMLNVGGKSITLQRPEGKQFRYFRTQKDVRKLVLWKWKFPVSLMVTEYRELEKRDFFFNMAEARAAAEKAAMKEILSKVPKEVEVVSRKVNVSSANEKEIKVVVYVETMEDIGGFVPLK